MHAEHGFKQIRVFAEGVEDAAAEEGDAVEGEQEGTHEGGAAHEAAVGGVVIVGAAAVEGSGEGVGVAEGEAEAEAGDGVDGAGGVAD